MEQNICIYKKEYFEDVESEDHIILAAIGGKAKLPANYVSHSVNQMFSKIEGRFIRDTHFGIARQFRGPGKRGSIKEREASKSKVCILDRPNEEMPYLGYIKRGSPYYITQYAIRNYDYSNFNGNLEIEIVFNSEEIKNKDEEIILNKFIKDFKKQEDLKKHVLIVDKKISLGSFLYGKLDDKFYLGVNSVTEIDEVLKILKLMQGRELSSQTEPNNEIKFNITANQSVIMNSNEIGRVIAKMAFNFLAFKKGNNFVLEEKFDSIRNWIYKGESENKFVNIISDGSNSWAKNLLNNAMDFHYIFICVQNEKLLALVSIYGMEEYLVNFSPNYLWRNEDKDFKNNERYEIVCDFVKGQEYYSAIDFLKSNRSPLMKE